MLFCLLVSSLVNLMFLMCESIMFNCFVVAAMRGDCLTLKSYHSSLDLAEKALNKSIDSDALYVVKARMLFAKNGSIRFWSSLK